MDTLSKGTKELTIYTDGGCHGNPGAGGYGCVILLDGKELERLSGGEALTTNNRMELMAAIKALEYVEGHKELLGSKVLVYSDSQYLKNGITTWIKTWCANGWRTSNKKAVKNRDLWEVLHKLNASLAPTWRWVKGHAGVKYNEICDSLCQKSIALVSKEGSTTTTDRALF